MTPSFAPIRADSRANVFLLVKCKTPRRTGELSDGDVLSLEPRNIRKTFARESARIGANPELAKILRRNFQPQKSRHNLSGRPHLCLSLWPANSILNSPPAGVMTSAVGASFNRRLKSTHDFPVNRRRSPALAPATWLGTFTKRATGVVPRDPATRSATVRPLSRNYPGQLQ